MTERVFSKTDKTNHTLENIIKPINVSHPNIPAFEQEFVWYLRL